MRTIHNLESTRLVMGGVDTHKSIHVAAVVDELGRTLGTESFPTTTAGYRRLLVWLRSFGALELVGVEGTGVWGAGLATVRALDFDDAHALRGEESAARAALTGEASGTPTAANGGVEAIRLLQVARRSAMKARTQAANQLHAVVTTAPEPLRASLTGLDTKTSSNARRGCAPQRSPTRPQPRNSRW